MAGQESWGIFLGCAFVAEIIGTIAGFGAATILTPVAILFMDVKAAIAVVACFHLAGTGARVVFFRRSIAWRVWAQFGLMAVCCGILGAVLTAVLPSALLMLLFGIFLLVYVGLSVVRSQGVTLPATPAMLIGGGAASGFIAGLLGTGGAVRAACLLAFGLSKDVYLGTSASIALVVDVTRLPVYLTKGFIPRELLFVVISLVLVAFVGAWVGRRLVARVPATAFRRLVLGMLALMAVKMLIDGWRGLV